MFRKKLESFDFLNTMAHAVIALLCRDLETYVTCRVNWKLIQFQHVSSSFRIWCIARSFSHHVWKVPTTLPGARSTKSPEDLLQEQIRKASEAEFEGIFCCVCFQLPVPLLLSPGTFALLSSPCLHF